MSTAKVDMPSPAPVTDSAPRKRRRRAPTAGAADDCFTCSNRGSKCDRRRPYCSQCLDDGKDCSGYKTTLTWGVGVASRGKLRGLSLPIAGTAKASSPTSTQFPRKKSAGAGERPSRNTQSFSSARSIPAIPPNPYMTSPAYDFVGSDLTSNHMGIPVAAGHWPNHPPMPPHLDMAIPPPLSSPHHLQPLNVPITKYADDANMPTSASSLGGFSDASFGSPVVYSASSDEASYPTTIHQSHHGHRMSFHEPQSLVEQNPRSWPPANMTLASAPMINSADIFDPVQDAQSFMVPDPPINDGQVNGGDKVQEEDDIDGIVFGNDTSLIESPTDLNSGCFNNPFSDSSLTLSPYSAMTAIGKTPRMKYLINYYTEVISPVIVAFDGPNNPYRTHILRLAMESETLQHAIAALSASNLRQRKGNNALSTGKTDPARRSSMAHCALTDESLQSDQVVLSVEDQAGEEKYHKGMSIQSLNSQLADPNMMRDDSILATLLILCLFHICDSGVAKFKTQFAGVKKLLSLRGNDPESNSRETKWYTRMFTWFDAFTSTVNDREGQLQGIHLDISSLSDEEWALENLAGCDGRLFQIMAQLGRLNVLSQSKPVDQNASIVSRPPPLFSDFTSFDADGWSNLLADEDLFQMNSDDMRTQFWREWHEIRRALQSWQLDTSILDSTTPLTLEQKIDLSNISESFRYSALLYTERLASPTAPSTDGKIQELVEKSLEYIKAVKSDVYLLWPLFITGSECVDEAHRSVIRQRCLDIQKDSGFLNNYSCLELLEKVWSAGSQNQSDTTLDSGDSGAVFKWRGVMDAEHNEGEYIVV